VEFAAVALSLSAARGGDASRASDVPFFLPLLHPELGAACAEWRDANVRDVGDVHDPSVDDMAGWEREKGKGL
jgi:hypothetical protein